MCKRIVPRLTIGSLEFMERDNRHQKIPTSQRPTITARPRPNIMHIPTTISDQILTVDITSLETEVAKVLIVRSRRIITISLEFLWPYPHTEIFNYYHVNLSGEWNQIETWEFSDEHPSYRIIDRTIRTKS